MSHLESPELDVEELSDDDFRVIVRAEHVQLKFDLSKWALFQLAQEALEAILVSESEADDCSFCGPESGQDEGGTCELEAMLAELIRSLRLKKHKRGS